MVEHLPNPFPGIQPFSCELLPARATILRPRLRLHPASGELMDAMLFYRSSTFLPKGLQALYSLPFHSIHLQLSHRRHIEAVIRQKMIALAVLLRLPPIPVIAFKFRFFHIARLMYHACYDNFCRSGFFNIPSPSAVFLFATPWQATLEREPSRPHHRKVSCG